MYSIVCELLDTELYFCSKRIYHINVQYFELCILFEETRNADISTPVSIKCNQFSVSKMLPLSNAFIVLIY